MKKEIKLKYKIGDRVRITKKCTNSFSTIGTIETIIDIDKSAIPYQTTKAFHNEVCFKLVKSPKKVIKKKKPQKTVVQINIYQKINGWELEAIDERLRHFTFVFNTKTRLLKWIEKNI